MAKKHEEHTTSIDSPPVEGGYDYTLDSPRQEDAPEPTKSSKPIQDESK